MLLTLENRRHGLALTSQTVTNENYAPSTAAITTLRSAVSVAFVKLGIHGARIVSTVGRVTRGVLTVCKFLVL